MKAFKSGWIIVFALLIVVVACDRDDEENLTERMALDDDLPEMTMVSMDGGVVESEDGHLKITFPANSYDPLPDHAVHDELGVRISSRDGYDGDPASHYVVTQHYNVLGNPTTALEELNAPARVELTVTDAPSGAELAFIDSGSTPGIITGTERDGDTLIGEFSDLSKISHAVAFEISERCAELNPMGTSCSDDDDCITDGADSGWYTCVCNNGEVNTANTCHGGKCFSPMAQCAGLGMSSTGWCKDEDRDGNELGGWAGDCYRE